MQPSLTEIMRGFFRGEKKQSIKLKGGLILAYTPPQENEGCHRLTISRPGVAPSPTEQRVIRSTLGSLVHMKTRIERSQWFTDTHHCITYNWPDPRYQPALPIEVSS